MPDKAKIDFTNFTRAMRDLSLTDQEANLYQHHLRNLYGPGKVFNENGSISTVYQMSVEIGGKTYNIPTVWNGRILPADEALKQAKQVGLDVWPSYPSTAAAESRYQDMHKFMDLDQQQFITHAHEEISHLPSSAERGLTEFEKAAWQKVLSETGSSVSTRDPALTKP